MTLSIACLFLITPAHYAHCISTNVHACFFKFVCVCVDMILRLASYSAEREYGGGEQALGRAEPVSSQREPSASGA